jgi:hypothetical protein
LAVLVIQDMDSHSRFLWCKFHRDLDSCPDGQLIPNRLRTTEIPANTAFNASQRHFPIRISLWENEAAVKGRIAATSSRSTTDATDRNASHRQNRRHS